MDRKILPSERSQIDPFIVMEVMKDADRRAAEKDDVLHLEVGEPGLGAPQAVRDAAANAVQTEALRYTEALGALSLRERIAEYYRETADVEVPAARIAVTGGSSAAFMLAFLAAFDPGAKLGITSPGYPGYRNISRALGIEAVDIPLDASTGFRLSPDSLDAVAGDLNGLLIASPANPTGTMIAAEDLRAVHEISRRHGIKLISDEIYHGITFQEPAQTLLAFGEDVIVINSFSKYFCMTGWRLGWMVVPESFIRPVERLAQNCFISPPGLSQIAAREAFDCTDELDSRVRAYREGRDVLIAALGRLGLKEIAPADGAFYVYADVSQVTNDSTEFCRRLLADTGVAATPGTDFDPLRGNRFVRFSCSGAPDEINEAARRIEAWLP